MSPLIRRKLLDFGGKRRSYCKDTQSLPGQSLLNPEVRCLLLKLGKPGASTGPKTETLTETGRELRLKLTNGSPSATPRTELTSVNRVYGDAESQSGDKDRDGGVMGRGTQLLSHVRPNLNPLFITLHHSSTVAALISPND